MAAPAAAPPVRDDERARRVRPPAWLALAAVAVAAVVCLPVGYLALLASQDLGRTLDDLMQWRTVALAARSLGLTAAVTAASVGLAVPLAWLTVRTDLPGRRVWTVLTALPLVLPSYIAAALAVSLLGPSGELQDLVGVERLPSIYGFPGAFAVLTLVSYPLVLLTVRSALARLDPALEDAARAMGRSPWAVFRTVVAPQLGPAVGAGALLVALYALSDFGAVSLMRFDSFTRVIYTEYRTSFDRVGAASLATLLVGLALVLLWLEGRTRRRMTYWRAGPGAGRPAPVTALGRWRWPALGYCAGVVAIALVLPVGGLVYWTARSLSGAVDWGALAGAALDSLVAAGLAAAVAAACALPVALLAARYDGRVARGVERAAWVGHALPGIVVALALVFFGTRVAAPLYQTLAMLVVALVVLFLPLALGASRAAILQVSPRVEEAARGMGRSTLGVTATITAPLARGGVLAGAALVFLTAIKELPATLLLAPIGFETLAVATWRATSIGSYERGAVPALVLLAVSAPPLWLLTRRS